MRRFWEWTRLVAGQKVPLFRKLPIRPSNGGHNYRLDDGAEAFLRQFGAVVRGHGATFRLAASTALTQVFR
jgi:hypothetical protein